MVRDELPVAVQIGGGLSGRTAPCRQDAAKKAHVQLLLLLLHGAVQSYQPDSRVSACKPVNLPGAERHAGRHFPSQWWW